MLVDQEIGSPFPDLVSFYLSGSPEFQWSALCLASSHHDPPYLVLSMALPSPPNPESLASSRPAPHSHPSRTHLLPYYQLSPPVVLSRAKGEGGEAKGSHLESCGEKGLLVGDTTIPSVIPERNLKSCVTFPFYPANIQAISKP